MQRNNILQIIKKEMEKRRQQAQLKVHWENYNTNGAQPGSAVVVNINGEEKFFPSYSDYFFDKWKLVTFIDQHNKHMLQFGASTGVFLKKYQDNGWQVMAYDYSGEAVKSLQEKHLPAKQIDLNSVSSSHQLNYDSDLTADLSSASNIVSVRILQYLTPEAMCLLVAALMDKAQPNSVFFFVNSIKSEQEVRPTDSEELNRNYIKSFFSPRTDMQILFSKATDDADQQYKMGESLDEVLVCKKRKSYSLKPLTKQSATKPHHGSAFFNRCFKIN